MADGKYDINGKCTECGTYHPCNCEIDQQEPPDVYGTPVRFERDSYPDEDEEQVAIREADRRAEQAQNDYDRQHYGGPDEDYNTA